MSNVIGLNLKPRFGMKRATSAIAHYERGCTLEASDPDAAISAYTRAVAGRPDHADAWNNLGRIAHERRDFVTAESCYRLAICAAGDVALYQFNLAVLVEDRGRFAEAIALYQAALVLDATLADAHYNLARLLDAAGDRMRAIRHLASYKRRR